MSPVRGEPDPLPGKTLDYIVVCIGIAVIAFIIIGLVKVLSY